MDHFLKFKPLIKNSHCQTIIGSALTSPWEVHSTSFYVKLPDDDVLALEISTPKAWQEKDWTVLLLHGLCGSHKSHYMSRLAKKFYKAGLQAVRINMRGCGTGRGLARSIYHSGSSDDVLEVVKAVREKFPNSPLLLVGFSLGANVILKLGGELQDKAKEYLKGLIAIGPPVDLLASARLVIQPHNRFYAKYFLRLLLDDVNFRHTHFPDLGPHNLPSNINMSDFDELYVAPRAHYSNALEYYYYCSSKKVVQDIALPTKILFAEDDPIIKPNALDHYILPSHVEVYKTAYGGHIGFMGQNIFKDFRWLDNQILSWIEGWRSSL